ncbi:hypothetical protein SUGI_0652010 [Cryptomeria japonica]|nr:hypothetical protein SUGI_0652010 [Cryptomeria japonica]
MAKEFAEGELTKEKVIAWAVKGEDDCETNSNLWDCESSLYDSFELRSFSFQLNRALTVVSRSSPCGSPLHAHAQGHHPHGCFRSFSAPRNAEFTYDKKSLEKKLRNPKQKHKIFASWSLKKLIRAFHKKAHHKNNKVLT